MCIILSADKASNQSLYTSHVVCTTICITFLVPFKYVHV